MAMKRHNSTPLARYTIVALTVGMLVALVGGAAACGGSKDSSDDSAGASTTASSPGATDLSGRRVPVGTVPIALQSIAFLPDRVTIQVGQTVVWTNEDPTEHDVVADNGDFKSKVLGKGDSYSFAFEKAGTFPYHCSLNEGMTGTIIVVQ
jgi:plastocyanin